MVKATMRRVITALVICTVSCASYARPERNAFLDQPVSCMADLVQQVRHDPAVADRYERHFGMSFDQVIFWFKSFHVRPLYASDTVSQYSAYPDGSLHKHTSVLAAGTLVFADQNDHPILRLLCGNPIYKGSETQSAVIPPSLSPHQVSQVVPMTPTDAPGTPSDSVAMTPPPSVATEDIAEVLPPVTPITPVVPETPPVITPPATPPVELHDVLTPLFSVAAAAGGLISVAGGSTRVQPSPEPLMIAILALGVAGTLALKKNR